MTLDESGEGIVQYLHAAEHEDGERWETWFRIQHLPGKGRGLIAARHFHKGDNLIPYLGTPIGRHESEEARNAIQAIKNDIIKFILNSDAI